MRNGSSLHQLQELVSAFCQVSRVYLQIKDSNDTKTETFDNYTTMCPCIFLLQARRYRLLHSENIVGARHRTV